MIPPMPEPAGDIRAQLTATLDPGHPKRAAFLVPADAVPLDKEALRQAGVHVAERDEGVLVTLRDDLAEMFLQPTYDTDAFDALMAVVLDLPEPKPLVIKRCNGRIGTHARAIQARDRDGHVVQECVVSSTMFLPAIDSMRRHVPDGGRLVFLGTGMALARRAALRWVER